MTPSEIKLWVNLKGHSGRGFTIRKQHPVGPYIVDFYCEKARLAIEIDGAVHTDERRAQADAVRDAWLAEQGIETLRFSHEEVMTHGEDIAADILRIIRERIGLPPLP